MIQYLDMLEHILTNGRERPDRTGTGTFGVFGYQFRHNLQHGFPLLTTKKIFTKPLIHELIWFLRGDTNIKYLVENGVHIWTDWPLKAYNNDLTTGIKLNRDDFEFHIVNEPGFAEEWGELGPVYGKQWRKWFAGFETMSHATGEHIPIPEDQDSFNNLQEIRPRYIDQITWVIEQLKAKPFDRGHVVSAWNVADLPDMVKSGLRPCHCMFQFNIRQMTALERKQYQDNNLEIKTVGGHIHLRSLWNGEIPESQWSADDLALAHRDIERWNKDTPKYYLDCQLYQRSADVFLGVPFNIASYAMLTHMIARQIGAVPGDFIHTFGDLHIYSNHMEQVKLQLSRKPKPLPTFELGFARDIFSHTFDDFKFLNYNPDPSISAPIAV